MTAILGILLLIVSIAYLVYWVKSLIIMKHEVVFLILGIFLSPFAQIGFMLTKRDTIEDEQATTLKRYFMVSVALFVLYFVFTFMALSQVAAQQAM
ncbi:MAG: hypothetical protein Q4B82_03860 [Alysiella sp.]|uniref:hypothetical protein n=1 Tax=Alysiella sp. TaxID=1872483 RepID=UPI0026DAC01F|nr:hypothetical protein [Alysiella sp.]MDO4433696.1 hypothetical protein [Alysiella sp.]